MGNKKVVIIGGGPAGLTGAYELSKAGLKSTLLEKDSVVGGISRTVRYKNYYYDIGGHRFFTKSKRVDDMWREVLGKEFLKRDRMSRIYYKKKFFFYPLRPFNALQGLGTWQSLMIMADYVRSKFIFNKVDHSYEQWIINRFGKRLYETFFKTYTEKVWGVPCSEISAEWASQRIQGLSLMGAIKDGIVKSIGLSGNGNNIKTLINSFDYPMHGPGMMWQAVSEIVKKNGSKIYLNSEVESVFWDSTSKSVSSVKVCNKNMEKIFYGTHFLTSMPITELIFKLKPKAPEPVYAAANALKYRDFITVVLIIEKTNIFPDNWIYIQDPNIRLCRLQNYNNWSPHMVPDQKQTCVGLEYFCFEGDDIWNMADNDLIALGKRELETLGFAKATDVKDATVTRMPKAYPIYNKDYHLNLKIIRNYLDGFRNLQTIGRNGLHRYNNQDHSMMTAMLAIENIFGAKHNLWKVNTDMEYHESN